MYESITTLWTIGCYKLPFQVLKCFEMCDLLARACMVYKSITILQTSPVIPEGSSLYTHHMLIFLCMSVTDMDVGSGSVCDSASINVSSCRRESLLAAWAVGGTVSAHSQSEIECL